MMDMSFLSQPRVAVQVPNPIESMSKVVGLRNALLEGQDIASQTRQRESEAQQREVSLQQGQQAAQAIHDHLMNGGTLDDPELANKLYAVNPTIGEAHAKSRQDIRKSNQDITKSQADIANEQAKLVPEGERQFQADYKNYLAANNLQPNAAEEYKYRQSYVPPNERAGSALRAAQARKETADAVVKEMEAGSYPQTVDAAQAKLDAIAPPTDKTFADTNKRFSAMLKAGQFTPAVGADVVKQAAKEAESISVAKNTVPFKVEVQNAGASQATGAGLDLMAEQALNGQFSSRNPVLMSKVYQRAADMAKERGLTSTGVIMAQNAAKANKDALNTITTQMTQVEAFSQTAAKNMTTLEKAMGQVGDLGAPFLNTPLRNIQSKYAGNPKVSAFYAALQPVQTEIAKILNSSNASGVLTDSARHEMESALGPGATPAQLKAALDVFRQDIENRRSTYSAMQQDLIGKTAVGAGGADGKPQPGGAPAGGTGLTDRLRQRLGLPPK